MDGLSRFTLWRVRCRLHPYIMPEEGWRRYPPHVASLLEHLEPLHIIAIGPTWVGVDGAYVDDARERRERLRLIVETVEAVFGEAEEKDSAGNLELFWLNTGLKRFHLYWGSVWYVALCTDARPYPSRFAYVANSNRHYAPMSPYGEAEKILCTVAAADGAKVRFDVSQEFFLNPKPENARLFGDLLFLGQAGNGWNVEREVDVEYSCGYAVDGLAYIANVLGKCEGLESFVKHAYEELLVREPSDSGSTGWRAVVKALQHEGLMC
jgi:hypothetical protein